MEKRCFNCMEILEKGVCPSCGFKAEPDSNELVLKERYQIGNIFSKSLESTVYIAYDNALNKKVLVREFTGESIIELIHNYPKEALVQRFLSYSKTAATVSLCDILPRTIDTFAEGEAAYWVTDYFDGKSLKELLNSGVKISSSNAMKIASQLLKGLKPIHTSGSVFGAISPETLFILKNGEIRLFGIGSSFYDFTDDLDFRVELLNPSYAAPEFFDKTAKIGAYSDVYSVAAIVYRIITGKIPAISFLRSGGENLIAPRKTDKNIPQNIEIALLNALNWQTEKRTPSPESFLNELSEKKVKRKLSGLIIWANILGFCQGLYDKSASKKSKNPTSSKDYEENENKNKKEGVKIPFLWLWITIPSVILVGLVVLLIILFPPTNGSSDNVTSTSTESDEIWYYGNGVETPNNSSNYVYGGGSSKKQTVSTQSRPQNTTSVDPNAVECPDLAGYSLSQAKSILENNNLLLGTIRYEYSNDYPADYVMGQSLKSGGMIPKGSKINLIVCKGAVPAQLPDVTGLEMQKAVEKLKNAGFNNIEYSFVLSDDAIGLITDVLFENEEDTSVNSKVILVVSGEKANVENYLDKTAAQMKNLTGDFVFEFKLANGNPLPENADLNVFTIVDQSIKEGEAAYKGMTIELTVVSLDD